MQRAKAWLHIVLPWPMVAWCERLYFAQFGEIELCMVKHLCRPDQDSIDVGGNVGFIKIDVEGHEHSVLQGAQRTIERCRPRVLIEAEERHAPGSVRRIQAFFRRFGYRGYFVFHRQLAPIERFDPARMQRSE